MKAKIVSLCVFLLCIPAICVVGVLFFKERSVSFACTGIVIAMLAAYFYVYEKKSSAAWELVIVALMSALSVVGRIVFAFLPSLKPCSAIIILTAIYFGRETGFMVGAFTALVSNFYFGQGGWTPFQMLAWGLTGYFALCRNAGQVAVEKPHSAAYLQRGDRRIFLAADGLVQLSVDGRKDCAFAVFHDDRDICVGDCGVRGVQRGVHGDFYGAVRQDFQAAVHKVRDWNLPQQCGAHGVGDFADCGQRQGRCP